MSNIRTDVLGRSVHKEAVGAAMQHVVALLRRGLPDSPRKLVEHDQLRAKRGIIAAPARVTCRQRRQRSMRAMQGNVPCGSTSHPCS